MGPFGWALSLAGVVILATSLFLLQRDWFEVARERKPRLSPNIRRLLIAGIVLGAALFAVAMIVGPGR